MKPLIAPTVVIIALAFARLIPHMPNFAPITAMALFGGAYLGRRYAFIIPILAMIVSDYLLLYVNPFSPRFFDFSHVYPPQALLHGATWAVYGSFVIAGFVGVWLRDHKSPIPIVLSSAFCSLQFFLITNAAVWMGGMYDRSILGLWESYVAGVPFLQGTLMGDFFWVGALFGGYELAVRLMSWRPARHTPMPSIQCIESNLVH